MRLFAVLVAVIVTLVPAEVSAQVSPNELILAEWSEFKLTHGKVYKNSRHEDRSFQIYLETRESVAKHNREFALGLQSFDRAVREFADISYEELVAKHIGFDMKSVDILEVDYNKTIDVSSLPASVDWREKGVITPVRRSGGCRASWAFSSLGALEAATAIKTGKLVQLSVQQLLDCMGEVSPCDIGYVIHANRYIIANGGVDDEASYPYEHINYNCRFDKSTVAATMSKYLRLPHAREDILMDAVANIGPITAGIHTPQSFVDYKSGVFSAPNCPTGQHFMFQSLLIVGYGTDPAQGDYWIAKNSMGEDWGEKGYIRVARNKNNMCGIATLVVYPIV